MVKHLQNYFISLLTCFFLTGCTLGEEPVGFERDTNITLVKNMLCISIPQNDSYYLSIISVKKKDGSELRKTYAGSELLAVNSKRCLSSSQWPVVENNAYTIHYTLLSTSTKLPAFRKVASLMVIDGSVLNLKLYNSDYLPSFISE
ncbi:hypothetical protein SOM41_22095 [Enterobacter sp. CFBP8995]|nr:hypothetical protein [Enterobacter sp. CFBP8995]